MFVSLTQIGEHKLTAVRPSTSPIGSARVIQALHALSRRHRVHLQAWRLLGRTHARHNVHSADSETDKDTQWAAVRDALTHGMALIYHLRNHYSLVYAIRTWRPVVGTGQSCAGHPVRQVLIAAPGQEPNRWQDFEAVRQTLLAWSGYGVMCVSSEASAVTPQ
jgi:hypothetical protein